MEENPQSPAPIAASGGLLRLQGRLTHPPTWLGPTWATWCGVVASGGYGWQGADWLRLLLLILLVDGGWGTLWTALATTDWAAALRRWHHWRFGPPAAALPYTLPGSPGDRASRWLGQVRAWWGLVFRPACGEPLSAIAVALLVTAVLSALLGVPIVLLSAAALAVMQLGFVWEGGRGAVAPGWDAVVAVALPWLAGHAACGSLTWPSALLGLAFALAWGTAWQAAVRWKRALGVGAQFLAAALLVVLRYPLAAGILLLLLAPQLAFAPWLERGQPAPWYVRYTRPWLMAAMLVAAWAL